ncbi:MAG TPA: DegT/DnrJ/EryC1/StrS aminotransferase family protein [Bryobacteraceae bacterium]|nr:DegT/DnrJ/EryC1/StrS aminotransferase family protein [Bryobacteraceae bacterium]
MSDSFIRFHRPSIGEDEINEVVETLKSGWLTTGPRVARFEREFREHTAAPQAIAVNSATAGLHLALAGLGIGPGDEVITTPMTFCATVQAILHVGATPVLADIGEDGNIDPEQIEQRITARTRAIIPVHLAGLPCNMDAIWALARDRGIQVVEDAAHAAGAFYEGRPIGAGPAGNGNASDAVAFSFYATKNLTTGEGGMITTHLSKLAETVRLLALHGVSHDAWDRYSDHGDWHYDVLAHGFKYNLSDIQAAIGIHQLRKLNQFVERRAFYARKYHAAFAGMEELEPPPDNPRCRHAWHLYILRLNLDSLKIDRAEFIRELRQRGIGASVHFIPIPMLRFFAKLPLAQYACPRASNLYPRIVSLPLYPAMTEEQVQHVATSVREIVKSSRRVRSVAPNAQAAAVPATPADASNLP